MAATVACIILLVHLCPLLLCAGKDNIVLNHPSLKSEVPSINIRYWLGYIPGVHWLTLRMIFFSLLSYS